MIRLSRQSTKGITEKATRMVALSIVVLIFTACGGGDGVQLGSGQDPDPVVIDFPIAYIKSPLPVDDNGVFQQQDLREQITFEFGADLYFRDRASPSSDASIRSGGFAESIANSFPDSSANSISRFRRRRSLRF